MTDEEKKQRNREAFKRWYSKNKEVHRRRVEKYREENPEKVAEICKKYYEKNKKHLTEYGRQYRVENKEKLDAKSKRWYEENREYVAERNRKYWEENKEKLAVDAREYRLANKEKIDAVIRKYREKNPEHERLVNMSFTLIRESLLGVTNDSTALFHFHGYSSMELREWARTQINIPLTEYTKDYTIALRKNMKEFDIHERGDEEFKKCFSFKNMHFRKRILKRTLYT